jgi:uncharacterized protein
MKKTGIILFLTSCFLSTTFFLNGQVPERPAVQRLVNDLAGLFTVQETETLEAELVDFDNSSSNQICIVTVAGLHGEDINMAAYQILVNWGVGSASNNNGVVILVEHAPGSQGGRVAISVGYGLEGVLTDALSKRIITYDIIPAFREDRYYDGVRAGVASIKAVAMGEYDTARKQGDDTPAGVIVVLTLFIILFFFVLIIYVANKRKGPTNLGGTNRKGPSILELMILANLLGGKSRGGSGFGGGFGGGGFGGGGFSGGFGGFGGGLGGGGGASGSW